MTNTAITVRRATPADAEAIAAAHRDSIRSIGPQFYPPDMVDVWCENLGAALYTDAMTGGEAFFVVTGEVDGAPAVLGFSTHRIDGSTHATAVYVRGSVARRGIGSLLFRRAESEAIASGAKTLDINASLPGVEFYRAQGFEEIARGETPLRSGRTIATVSMRKTLSPRVALVTGASRGVGKGVARALVAEGFAVYAAARSIAGTDLGPGIARVPCDVTDEDAVVAVFDRIRAERGRLDVLVNSAWGGYERMVEGGQFTWSKKFWEQPLWRWDAMVTVGVRGAFVASQHAARLMIPAGRGLIVHISTWAAQKYIGNVIYGVAKAASDKLAADMARELAPHGITVVSMYPGLVRTEAVLAAGIFDLSNSESPDFTGRAVAALARDRDAERRSGKVVVAAALATEYGFKDEDGRQPRPLTLADV